MLTNFWEELTTNEIKKINIFKKTDYLWRTFSPDQIDLNFKNPSVLLRFVKIMIK